MERLGMLRGVRMASVGAFVLIRRMLRLICGRRFALITVAMAIVVAYQLTDDLFISYGTVGADSLLGVDLPPLFMAAMTMGGSEAFALLLPLALLADSAWSFKNGYLSLLVAKGVDPVRLSLSCMVALMIATMLSFAVVALVTGAVCALVCSGSFETGLINMADTDFAPMLSWGAAVALAFHALWNLWRDALPLRELVAVPMASSLAFGCSVCFDALVPVVLSCGVVCIAAMVVHACSCASVSASSIPGESVPHGGDPRTSPRAFSLRIGLVRGAALVVAGVSCGMLFQLLNGSYTALHPWRLASSLAWHLVLHGTTLSAVLYVSMRAMRFAQRAGRSLPDVLSPIAMPWLLGFGCSSGVLVDALLQPHGSVRSVIALVAIGMVCGAWALARTIASYRRRLAFSRRTAGFLDQALEGSGLTDAECVVLGYLFRGFTAAGIARELTVSLNTARTHVRHVYAKLGVHGRSELFDAVERRLERYEERL